MSMLQRGVREVAVDEEARELRVIASDESVDRYGDVIRADGWDLKHFKRNPVLLFSHDSRSPPIGIVKSVGIEGKKLIATAKFLPEGTYDFADTIWRIVKAGALRAVSVGFLPTAPPVPIRDKEDRITGIEWTEQELLELSVVPVPANPQALAIARGLSLRDEDIYRLFAPGAGERDNSPSPESLPPASEDPKQEQESVGAQQQRMRAFPRDLVAWESEQVRRALRIRGI